MLIMPNGNQLWEIEEKYCGDSCIDLAIADTLNLIVKLNGGGYIVSVEDSKWVINKV